MRQYGWQEAHRLPLARLWTETAIVRQRERDRRIDEALLSYTSQLAVHVKNGGKVFEDQIKRMRADD